MIKMIRRHLCLVEVAIQLKALLRRIVAMVTSADQREFCIWRNLSNFWIYWNVEIISQLCEIMWLESEKLFYKTAVHMFTFLI